MKPQVSCTVSGLVQGVGFRWFVQREAVRLGLTGWVRNNADGSVSLLAQGEREVVEQFLTAVRRGPRSAMVQDLRLEWTTAETPLPGFDIR